MPWGGARSHSGGPGGLSVSLWVLRGPSPGGQLPCCGNCSTLRHGSEGLRPEHRELGALQHLPKLGSEVPLHHFPKFLACPDSHGGRVALTPGRSTVSHCKIMLHGTRWWGLRWKIPLATAPLTTKPMSLPRAMHDSCIQPPIPSCRGIGLTLRVVVIEIRPPWAAALECSSLSTFFTHRPAHRREGLPAPDIQQQGWAGVGPRQ